LKRQSEKAEKYVAYKNELKELEVAFLSTAWTFLKATSKKTGSGRLHWRKASAI
jgi:chromosome segregation ATPase